MNRYIHFVLRKPIPILIMLVILTAVLVPGITRLEFDNSVEAFMPKNDPEYIYYTELKEIYGDNGRFAIMAVSGDDLWSSETLRKIDLFLADLEEYKDFDEEREASRLKRFDSIASRGEVRYSDLMAPFDDDPAFQRLLARKTVTSGKTDLISVRGLKKLREQIIRSTDFKKKEVIDTIISPLTSEDITGENDTLETYGLLEKDDNGKRVLPSSEQEIDTFRQRLERNPSFEKGLYSRDAQTGEITDFCVVIKFINLDDQDPAIREMTEVIDSYRGDLTITSSGVPVVNMWMNDYMHADLFKNIPLVLLVVVIVFYINFRSVRGVLLPFITLGLAELWILGLMGYIGYRITPVGVSIPPLMIAVGSSYAIHILNQYYADFNTIMTMDKRVGLYESMSHISLTVLLAGLTTSIAFMTLATSQVSAIREWGIASAIGVMFAVFISCSLIPASLVLLPRMRPSVLFREDKVGKTIVDRIIALMAKGAIIHYHKVLIVVAILIAVSVAGISRINIETSFMNYFREHDRVKLDTRVIGDKFGGGWGYDIVIDSGKVDGVKNPAFLVMIEEFRQWLVSDANPHLNIGRTESFSDFIKTMHMAMNNDDISFYRIPGNPWDIIDYLEIYSGDDEDSDGRFDEFEPFVDIDFRTCNLLARLCEKEDYHVGTTEISRIADDIATHLGKTLPEGASYAISGFPMMNVKLVHYIVTGQMQSLFLSLLVVGLIVALLFRQIKAGPLALIPMSVAVIINFGIMGWLHINLDMATSVIAAITIGIGVDDTIHFLNTFRHNRARGLSVDETIRRTLAVSGKAILFTSLALVFGFSVLMTSNFLPIALFGILTATTMINTTIGALLVLPSVIKATGINLESPESDSRTTGHLSIDKFFGMEQNDSEKHTDRHN
ncbi:MAG: MMPL family transporter [Deltaproteobacteria bacterium]|nr:MMPL family transporter [Deltaproteobacteria bacterium]MBW2649703.1 MMPL family transporter [Deltaproteobacteria bacterium]